MDLRFKSKLKKITTFIFDVDGVFTDGRLIVGDTEVQRVFHVRDGYAVQMAAKADYKMAIISGGKQESIKKRLGGLGIKDIFLAVPTTDKLKVFDRYLSDNNLKEEEVLFLGDDLPDYEIMKHRKVLSCCPADAVAEVKKVANYTAKRKGGDEVVREVIEMVLKAREDWLKYK